MKKLLLSALIATASLSVGEVQAAEYKQLKVMTQMTNGFLACNWDKTSPQAAQQFINEGGWQVMSVTPMQFIGHNFMNNTKVPCYGESVQLVR